MTRRDDTKPVGTRRTETAAGSRVPVAATRLVWLLWIGSLVVLAAHQLRGAGWAFAGVVAIDGLTVVMWVAVTFFSGIVHSYSRRYLAGDARIDRFFGRVFLFTLVVMVLVAADALVVFWLAWLGMGLVMAGLIGHVEGWPQARAAAALARRYFVGSGALLAGGLLTLWWLTGATTVSAVTAAVTGSLVPGPAAGNAATGVAAGELAGRVTLGPVTVGTATTLRVAAGSLVLAAMVQSALLPFHTWLLSSMTAPTPASALMHAGFVNAGGLLLVRFAPVLTATPTVMLAVVAVGAVSAVVGKLLKRVQPDVKGALGCSTVAQMGFMLLQAGLGFFAAAVTHLVLHGCYKAYLFLSSGGRVEHTSPTTDESGGVTLVGGVVTALTALAGGATFATLTGKGATLDGGVVLTLLVVVLTTHATWNVVRRESLPPGYRYAAVPFVAVPAVALYGVVYTGVARVLSDLPVVTQPAELTPLHAVVAAAFLLGYAVVETDAYREHERLYVWLVNRTRLPTETVLTAREEYDGS